MLDAEILRSQKFRPALQTIEVLDFLAHHIKPTIDLSSLPNLTLLRIHVALGQAGPLASIIASTNYFHKIVISPQHCGPESQQVDRILFALPVGYVPILEFEMSVEKYDRLIPFLPHMNAKNMLLRTDPAGTRWFERFVVI
ncbi:hypothetical protein C8R44DRAFT_865314 [Mycena epipterygia]|nr:hypothetical protein C8R44DRAFT_865314 [Mycena epipterygia]